MTRGSCRLCGLPGELFLRDLTDPSGAAPGSWQLARCRACTLIWLEPPPPAASFDTVYGGAYYTHEDDAAAGAEESTPLAAGVLATRYAYTGVEAGHAARWLRVVGPLADAAGAEIRYLAALPGGRLLDVGCGNGGYLRLMDRLGWDVTGVDPDARAIAAAPADIRDRLHVGTVETVALPPASFDAITLHHVLEHVSDPISTLRRCHALLRPGGEVVVITPNTASLGRRLFGRHWLHWDPPRHTFLFTRRSLAAAARQAGLGVIRLRTTARAARWTWRESRRLQAGRPPAGQPGRARGPAALAFQLFEHAGLPWAAWGEELVLSARSEEARDEE